MDATSVYWSSDLGVMQVTDVVGTLMKVPLSGGAPIALASGTVQQRVGAIAVDATSVYWLNLDNGPNGTTGNIDSVMKVPLDGGTPTIVVGGLSRSNVPTLAVDATSVYWTNSLDGTVMKAPLGGGTPTTLADGQGYPWDIAIDATSVYWTNANAGTVMKAPLDGGTPTTLAGGPSGPRSIAVDATSVYWTAVGDADDTGSVMKMPLDGGTSTTLAFGQGHPNHIAIDATSVYWVNQGVHVGDARVMKVSLGGGTPITISGSPSSNPEGDIAVDGTSVYWLNTDRTTNGRQMSSLTLMRLDEQACQSGVCK